MVDVDPITTWTLFGCLSVIAVMGGRRCARFFAERFDGGWRLLMPVVIVGTTARIMIDACARFMGLYPEYEKLVSFSGFMVFMWIVVGSKQYKQPRQTYLDRIKAKQPISAGWEGWPD